MKRTSTPAGQNRARPGPRPAPVSHTMKPTPGFVGAPVEGTVARGISSNQCKPRVSLSLRKEKSHEEHRDLSIRPCS
jgi:hypothetical protein